MPGLTFNNMFNELRERINRGFTYHDENAHNIINIIINNNNEWRPEHDFQYNPQDDVYDEDYHETILYDNEYDIYNPLSGVFTAEQDAFLDSTDDDDNDSQEAPNEETTQTEEPIQTTSSNMSSLNRLEIQPSGYWESNNNSNNNTIESSQNKTYLHYRNILNELSDIINYEYDEWQLTVINHYRNDEVMDDLIEDVQKYKNLLSTLYDLINNNYPTNTDDKDDLLTSIAELNDKCDTAITYPED